MSAHICFFDRQCWQDRKEFGTPMGVYWGPRKNKRWVILRLDESKWFEDTKVRDPRGRWIIQEPRRRR